MSSIDLHIHSNFSNDADFPPEKLVEFCLEAGLTHAAIADHNSVKGIGEALSTAEGTSLKVIPAVEMDCEQDGVVLHLLGYGFNYSVPVFAEIEADLHCQEQENSSKLMRLVREIGIDFDEKRVESMSYDGVVTGEMIAEAALIYDTENRNPLLDPYRGDGDRSDNPFVNFYWDFCSQGKPAYTPMDFISLAEAVEIIESNHGVPVLAHPGVNVKENAEFLKRIIKTGIKGIEVYSSYHNQAQVDFYKDAVLSSGLIMTCGSDFHGKTKKSIKIGGCDCEGQETKIITNLLQKIKF